MKAREIECLRFSSVDANKNKLLAEPVFVLALSVNIDAGVMLFGCLLFYYDLFNSFQIALKSYVIRKTNQKNLRRILRLVSNEPCFQGA